MITVESNALINVPSTIAICPYCNGKLSLTCHAWVQEDDRTWSADEITVLHCRICIVRHHLVSKPSLACWRPF